MVGLKVLALGCAISALGTAALAQAPMDPVATAANVKAHMTFLASDLLQGRDTGSPGFNIAANYVASQFAQLGLKPAGANGSYFQPTPIVGVRATDEGSFVLHGKGGESVLAPGVDIISGKPVISGKPLGVAELKVSAPLVFVGYGVEAAELKRDDYKGLDVTGKVVVVLSGAPANFQTEERAYHANARTKRALAAKHGAVGVITLQSPTDEKRRPFAAGARGWQSWAMSWKTADGGVHDARIGAPLLASVSMVGGEKLFAGARMSYADVARAAEAKGDPPRFALATSIDATIQTETKSVESVNVAGLMEGSDPALKAEVVVLSAHLDHIGVSAAGDDRINNGALDNASGVATTLEVARAFKDSGKRPRRSILFLAVTGEEKGLLGSEYFARNPTVPAASIVADVNLDMPILLYDFTDVVAFGAERSTIGDAVRKASARAGLALSADPVPEEGLFTRSDHFRFVETGVPSIFLVTGFQNGGEEKFRGFLAGCYHHPCDDLNQPIDYAAGAKFARINYEIARELADGDVRPKWKKGDFFATRFAKPEAIAER